MNYKEQIEKLKAIVLGAESKPEEVKLMEDEVVKEAAPEAEAPVMEYVTLAQFNELREDTKKFMESVTEMLSSAMEMINSTEKNKVPVEASKQEPEEEVVELAAEPVTHNPELAVRNEEIKVKLGAGAKKTFEDVAFEAWINSIKE
jgi:hypothetical protein